MNETRQYSEGEIPKVDYNQEFMVPYDVAKLTEKPEPGKASIEAFFTFKGNDAYAILPRWPGAQFTLKNFRRLKAEVGHACWERRALCSSSPRARPWWLLCPRFLRT